MNITISSSANKKEKYEQLLPQMEALFSGEDDFIANMANMAAVLHESFNFLWTGFYLYKDGMLVLGPFQGPLACTRIKIGSGVCGTAFQKKESILVSNVDEFPGHIACSPLSRSEIVIPIDYDGQGIGVLDIDSSELATFEAIDAHYLEKMVDYLLTYSKL